MDFWKFERIKMRILGKDGILYITLAFIIYFFLPIALIIVCPFIWLYEKITGREI